MSRAAIGLRPYWYALSTLAGITLLAACGGSQPPVGAPGAVPQTSAIATHADRGKSWIAQEAKGRDLLYVSNGNSGYSGKVFVYTYPSGKKIGTLAIMDGARGLCVDKAGDVFVTFNAFEGGTYEFAHGGQSPIAYLGYYYGSGDANACSIDPATGALAVIGSYESAFVTVYHYKPRRGWRIGRSYQVSGMANGSFCGYDDKGNLFCDGTTSSGEFALAELPSASKTFENIAVNKSIKAPGQVQWDGAHLAIGDTGVSPSIIYQFNVSGSTATEVGSTTLKGSSAVQQFWIQGGRIVVSDEKRSCRQSEEGCVAFYKYPAGGSAIKTLPLPGAFGATVSAGRH
jgi:hypothetical protein